MGTRLKEDEKNERIIRSLLKLPANRKCINCNSLGPQYVCTTFWTFICTTCSGIHREFTHRVKSVSMAKFTSQEVSSLQTGGNEHAKEIYFKELDLHRQGPDSSNVDRLRDFIKRVYVDKRYTGERSSDKPPRRDGEEANDNRRPDSSHSGSRSPPYEDTYQRRSSERASPGYESRSPGYEGRSPGYEQDNRRHSDYGRSPARPGIVSDWRREDRFANGRSPARSEGGSVAGGRSPDSQKGSSISSPPMVRPVRDILGDNATPLRIIEPPRVSGGGKIAESGSTQLTMRTASSSSLASSNGNPSESTKVDSLIDFDADPEPPVPATLTQPQPAPTQSVAISTPSTGTDDWACFDNAPEAKTSQTPASMDPMDSLFTQLSVPGPTPSPLSGVPAPGGSVTSASSLGASTPGNLVDSLVSLTTPTPVPTASAPAHNQNGAYASAPSNAIVQPNNNAAFSSDSAAGNVGPFASTLTSTLSTNSGAAQSSNMQNLQQSIFPGFGQSSSSKPVVQGAEAGGSQTPAEPVETKSTGRKELPADLFAAMYAPQPVAAHAWQTGFTPGMGYHMQFNAAAPAPTQPSAKPFNPFDVGAEAPLAQPTNLQFPSMTPMQAALPNVAAPPGSVGISNMNTVTPLWRPPQPAGYPSLAPHQAPLSGTTAIAPGTYLGQQLPTFLPPPGNQGFGGIGNNTTGFNSLNLTPSNPGPSGNPFG